MASETEIAQTRIRSGVVGLQYKKLQIHNIVELDGKLDLSRWQSCKRNIMNLMKYPEYGETREILSESAGTIPQG